MLVELQVLCNSVDAHHRCEGIFFSEREHAELSGLLLYESVLPELLDEFCVDAQGEFGARIDAVPS